MRRHTKIVSNDVGSAAWRHLACITALGHSSSQVFADWVELALCAHLSATDNLTRGKHPSDFDGPFEERYLKIVGRYASNRPRGERPADHFMEAYAELVSETAQREDDVLGELFMAQVSHGEHGQFFTPLPICQMLASITLHEQEIDGVKTVSDPAGCGSGRMFIAASKQAPGAVMHGIDVDHRCAMMATLNMILFNLNAEIVWGNGLSGEIHRSWSVRPGGWVTERT